MATLVFVWICVVAAIGTFMLAMLREKIMDQGLWMLWGVLIGGIGVAGGILLLEATKIPPRRAGTLPAWRPKLSYLRRLARPTWTPIASACGS